MDAFSIKIYPETFTPIKECYIEFLEDDHVVACANMISGKDSYYIINFEVLEKGKGYGRRIIEKLLIDKRVEGTSTEEALGFWMSFDPLIDEKRNFIIERRRSH